MKTYNSYITFLKGTFLLAILSAGLILLINSCKKTKEVGDEIDKFVEGKFEGIFKDSDGWEIELINDPDGSLNGSFAALITKGSYKAGSDHKVVDYITVPPHTNLNSVASHLVKSSTLANTWTGSVKSSEYFETSGKVTLEGKKFIITPNKGTSWEFTYSRPGAGWLALRNSISGSGSGSNGPGVIGTWYSPACGDSKGVIWKFDTDGRGSFSNKDCNGICSPRVFTFKYTLSGTSMAITYDALQPYIKCSGYSDSRPPAPKNTTISVVVSGNKLTVENSAVFTR
jgi:hypothetical protein